MRRHEDRLWLVLRKGLDLLHRSHCGGVVVGERRENFLLNVAQCVGGIADQEDLAVVPQRQQNRQMAGGVTGS